MPDSSRHSPESLARERLAAEPLAEERRQMVRVARLATGRASEADPTQEPRRAPAAGPIAAWVQAAEAATAWAYLAPFLWMSPFLAAPPLWIAALAQAPERPSSTARNRRAR